MSGKVAPYPCKVVDVEPFIGGEGGGPSFREAITGWGVTVQCGEGNFTKAILDVDDCWLAKLTSWPRGGGLGTASFPLVEEMFTKLSKGRCRTMKLKPASRRVEPFYKRLGFRCTYRAGGVMRYCMEMEKRLR